MNTLKWFLSYISTLLTLTVITTMIDLFSGSMRPSLSDPSNLQYYFFVSVILSTMAAFLPFLSVIGTLIGEMVFRWLPDKTLSIGNAMIFLFIGILFPLQISTIMDNLWTLLTFTSDGWLGIAIWVAGGCIIALILTKIPFQKSLPIMFLFILPVAIVLIKTRFQLWDSWVISICFSMFIGTALFNLIKSQGKNPLPLSLVAIIAGLITLFSSFGADFVHIGILIFICFSSILFYLFRTWFEKVLEGKSSIALDIFKRRKTS
ncbi:hypothetical protein [Shouchella lonarensis]|uniref:Uncharacterized protein n=1 Tax=Shouchella lonarensis TaxID=1464122 RepID=A0A1G6MQV9_9BACI|nr:hypothetical protein [Shouchella lonarensis]SDC57365.1 hypothetical protein SAMN05421737_11097 [Shouchella lonarensis]